MDFTIEKKGYATEEVDAYISQLIDSYEMSLAKGKERISELKGQLAHAENELKTHKEKSGLVSKAIVSAVAKAEEIDKLSKIKYNQEMAQLKAFHDKWTDYYNRLLERYPLDDELMMAGRFNKGMQKILSRAKTVEHADEFYVPEKLSGEDSRTETQIGYIRVKVDDETVSADDNLIDEMIPGADMNSPILSGNFDPVERINRYFESEIKKSAPQNKKGKAKALGNDYADRSQSGFSFEEALNPKEDLATIMRDLGLLMDD